MTKRIPIEEATRDQLFAFVRDVLQLEVDARANSTTLKARISTCWDQDFIEVVDKEAAEAPAGAPPQHPANVSAAKKGAIRPGEPFVELMINEQDKAGGKDPVFVGVNGIGMIIQRNERVRVPYKYFEALKHAVQDIHDINSDTGEARKRSVPSYPFQIYQMPSDDEIKAWLEPQSARAVA